MVEQHLLLFLLSPAVNQLLMFCFFILHIQDYLFAHASYCVDNAHRRVYGVEQSSDAIRLLIVPYGQTEQARNLAAATYQVLQGHMFDTIVFVCPTDFVDFHGVAMPWEWNDLQCLDLGYLEKLSYHSLFHFFQQPFCRHEALSWHVQMINLVCDSSVRIIPLIIGALSIDDARAVAMELVASSTPQTLLVLCADVSRYEHCIDDCPLNQSKICKVYDADAPRIQAIQAGALQQRVSLFDDTSHAGMFALLFELLQLPQFSHLASHFVGYTTSCDQRQAANEIFSHAAFVFQACESGYKNIMGSYEKLQLLQHARSAIRALFDEPVLRLPCMMSYEMAQPHGVFVSLYTLSDHGIRLRGCMGNVQTKLSLFDAVEQMSQQAACNDCRFYPLRSVELDHIMISLSVATDCTRIRDYRHIQQGDHVMMRYGRKEAVWQAAKVTDDDFDCQNILIQLSEQMGLQSFAWKKPQAQLFTFHTMSLQED